MWKLLCERRTAAIRTTSCAQRRAVPTKRSHDEVMRGELTYVFGIHGNSLSSIPNPLAPHVLDTKRSSGSFSDWHMETSGNFSFDEQTMKLTVRGPDGFFVELDVRHVLHSHGCLDRVARVRDPETDEWRKVPVRRGRFVGIEEKAGYDGFNVKSGRDIVDSCSYFETALAMRYSMTKKQKTTQSDPTVDESATTVESCDSDEVEILGTRTPEQRNAEGFLTAEIVE